MKARNLFISGERSLMDIAIFCMQVAVALEAIGHASKMFRQKLEINSEALIGWGASPYIATALPILLGIAFLVLAGLVILRPTPAVLWSIFTLILLLTAIKVFKLDQFSGLTIASRAARYLAPITLLMLLDWRANKNVNLGGTLNIMRIAIALTFFGHGVQVLFHSQKFIDLIQGSEMNILGGPLLGANQTLLLLDTIAIVDIVAAVLLLATRWSLIPLYMAGWTFLTATSRVFANGLTSWDDTAIRGTYYGIPLAIFLIFQWQKTHQTETEPVRVPSAEMPNILGEKEPSKELAY